MQLLVPAPVSLPLALLLGIGETFTGVLLLVPRFRRWGAYLAGALLVGFLVYIGINYGALRGKDCSCFPWVKRTIGPGFFIGDLVMIVLALLAGWWARASETLRSAVLVLAAISVFTLVSYGVTAVRHTGVRAPAEIAANGQPYSLLSGKIFLYFFDPECSHCDEAARQMAKYRWKETDIVVIPTRMPEFTSQFLESTGLRAKVSNDLDVLKKTFSFVSGPYAVALQHGRQKAAFNRFDEVEPKQTLAKLGYIE
jgi:hypothetical protein